MDLNEKMAAEIAAQLGLGGAPVNHNTLKKFEVHLISFNCMGL